MLFGKYLGEGMSQKEKDTATVVSFFSDCRRFTEGDPGKSRQHFVGFSLQAM